jgi:tryptophan synthase beta chain
MDERKIFLSESEMPTAWYNVAADLDAPPAPQVHPATKQPLGPDDLAAIFPMAVIEQEMSTEKWIEIPEPVRKALTLWRPVPLVRARGLEELLGTPARIYYKNESVSPAGSHKPNSSVAQAYYNKMEGVRRITTETGAGQWGSALSFACNMFDLECKVYMVRCSYEQKPYRKLLMRTWGADVVPSPSPETEVGRQMLKDYPESSGSLGMAISEAVEDAATHDDTKYSLGSVLNHVCLHQTIIGLETKKQFALVDDEPDVVIGCVGGGSNFAGLCFPYIADKLAGKDIRMVAVEPTACPTMTKGPFRYDFGDTAQMTPLMKMHTLGHRFVPSGIHAGGLRYHGMSPLLSHIADLGLVDARAYHQNPVFEAAIMFARSEGIVVAPETAHAVRAAIDEGLRCKAEGKEECIVFNLSGHGHFDLAAYEVFLDGKLTDHEHPKEAIEDALKHVPEVK